MTSKLILPTLVLLLPFTVYVFTLHPSVAPGDSTEMVTAAAVLGVPHHSSYPVNTIIGYLFSKLPIGKPVVWKINLAAAVLHSLTVVVFYFLVRELQKLPSQSTSAWVGKSTNNNLIDSRFRGNDKKGGNDIRGGNDKKDVNINSCLVAFTAAMFLAFSLIFWQYSTKFEVFPLNNLLVVTLLLIAVRISRDSASVSHKIAMLSFLAGFALVHHQTILLIFPAIIYLLWSHITDWLKEKQVWPKLLVIFAVGMLPFLSLLYISERNPPLNWGNNKNLGDVVAAFMRRDAGTLHPFVSNEKQQERVLIDQFFFYLTYIVFDFTVVGVFFAILGVVYLWKLNPRVLTFITSGFLASGWVFLAYANFPLSDSFNQATVRRFHMLPNLCVAMYVAFGIKAVFEGIVMLDLDTRKNTNSSRNVTNEQIGLTLGKTIVLLSFLYPLFVNFSKANGRENNLTETYVRDAYSETEKNALIMLSGDIPNMTVDYYRYVELKGEDARVTFTPGQFHLPWFTAQLKKRYPDLILPKATGGKLYTTATQIVDANIDTRPIYVGPDLVAKDPELEKKYVLWPKHLLFLVKKKGEDFKLEEYRSENDQLWESLDLGLLQSYTKNSPQFEETIVFYYARHYYNLGSVYEQVRLYEDAIREFKRVLQIDPYFKEALVGLGRVYGYKLEPPDFATAIDYLQKYQSVLKKGEEELGYAAQGMIEELITKAQKGATEEAKMGEIEKKMESSSSAEIKEATPAGVRND